MTNLFLKVNKDLFKLGLNPTEILILSQVMEFNTNTGDCFMSNKVFAEMLGVSESTVKREMDKLENLGFIKRETKNVQKGKERHIKLNLEKIEEKLASVKMNLVKENEKSTSIKMNLAEGSKCPLRQEQNEPIKDNVKDNSIKDNSNEMIQPTVEVISLQNQPGVVEEKKPEVADMKIEGTVSFQFLRENGVRYESLPHNLIRIIDTGKVFRMI